MGTTDTAQDWARFDLECVLEEWATAATGDDGKPLVRRLEPFVKQVADYVFDEVLGATQ